jgi:tRNA (mo5U34)-methyltransferase
MSVDLDRLGRFDLVFFLGVLYHLENPFLALKRLRQVTARTAIIETAAMHLPGHGPDTLWMFLEGGELNWDPSTLWVPNASGLLAACRAAGFRHVRVVAEPDSYGPPIGGTDMLYGRLTLHAEP